MIRLNTKVDNAIILAAGFASRFVPYSLEYPKALTMVNGEVLIERQIRQLHEAGIKEIIVVTGYRKEKFEYLQNRYQVTLVENTEYARKNNHASIFAARNYLGNSYICSSDNYFLHNPFLPYEERSFYSGSYSKGLTNEWCIVSDINDLITGVHIGGQDSWYMMGHVYWDQEFSSKFLSILQKVYGRQEIAGYLWEHLYLEHIDVLPLHLKRYPAQEIFEFDSLEELRTFAPDCDSENPCKAVNEICRQLSCIPSELYAYKPFYDTSGQLDFTFSLENITYCYASGIITPESKCKY